MDADCLVKLTKAKLKELVCKNFSVVIPQIVKEEITYNTQEHFEAMIISENIENKLITINTKSSSSKKGEDEIFSIFQQGEYDAICSDDKRFIKRLRFYNIPYITPAVFIALLLKKDKLTAEEARKKLDCLSSFVSDEEYNVIKAFLKNWGKQ